MTTLEEAKAFLKQECADGTNLYDHLSDVLLKILVERPENLGDSFEYISTAVKQQRYVAPPQAAATEASEVSNAKTEIVNYYHADCHVFVDERGVCGATDGAFYVLSFRKPKPRSGATKRLIS